MEILVPDYYKKFRCCGSECLNTCCAGWKIDVDGDSYKRYMSEEGELGEK